MSYEKPDTHVCNMVTCFTCYEKYKKGTEHKCYMRPSKQKPIKDSKSHGTAPQYMYFDIEAKQETGFHEMNYCIVYNRSRLYRLQPDSITTYKGKFYITDIELDKLNVDNINNYFTVTNSGYCKGKVL
jgi:hypothetical protein